jgi:Na+-translocating ferredoxin:NAD+ oxidoreductase RnfD subunit
MYSLLRDVEKSVLNVTEALWKNSLITAKGVLIVRVNLIAITLSEKKFGGITFVPSLVCVRLIVSLISYTYSRCRWSERTHAMQVEMECLHAIATNSESFRNSVNVMACAFLLYDRQSVTSEVIR